MAKSFFTQSEQKRIVDAIQQAELNTSGEIRVHIEANCEGEPYARAKVVFEELGMHATQQRNGILFYIAYSDKKLAILGDKGIHEKASQHFWDDEKYLMITYFQQNKYAQGLCEAIIQAGEKLKAYFPYQHKDSNELSNDISFGNGGKHDA